MKNKVLFLLAAGTMLSAVAFATPAQADRTGVWTGVDFGPSSYFAFLGAVTGIMGQDISNESGFLLRLSGGYGEYDYDTIFPGPTPTNVEGDVAQGDLMIGYRAVFPSGHLSAYVGGEYQNHDQSPRDVANTVEGSEGGVKGMLELDLNLVSQLYLLGQGTYSTAFDSYWSRATIGWNFGPVTIGPEVRFMGNEEFNQFRYGGALSGIDLGFAKVKIYGGYAESNGNGDDGAYGGIDFSKSF